MAKTLTQVQRKHHAKLIEALDSARNDVYAVVHPRTDIGFNDCLCVASQSVHKRYSEAYDALYNFENDMLDECRAWRVTFGMFTSYLRK